jgi:hypothetical protein
MPNDAKLGLLAGVAGVVTAAVLFYQNPPAAPPPTAAAAGAVAPPAGAVKPSQVFGNASAPAAVAPVSARGRKEPEGRAVSRSADDDE